MTTKGDAALLDAVDDLGERGPLATVAASPVPNGPSVIDGIRVGNIVAITGDGTTPLVTYPGQPGTAALQARALMDVHAAHVGRSAVLMFDAGDPLRPIIMGCLHEEAGRAVPVMPGHVEVHADGERLLVTAREQMVLRCGKASITLTRAGKLILEGAYVMSRSTGVLRLKGGSVQIN
jgi:hypothetical protein